MNPKFTLYSFLLIVAVCCSLQTFAQCTATVSIQTRESRCKATGEIIVTVTGGSGNYNYKVTNGAFSSVTSTNTISGLQAGTYTVEVKDIQNGCSYTRTDVVVSGNYEDPRFQLSISDVTCINGNNGTLTVVNQQYGRGPFTYTIVAPSISAVGQSNGTGVFNNLVSGDYYVRLTDSCGGIQTRAVTIANYNWWIDANTVNKNGCAQADAVITLRDSRGNTNTSGSAFNGYTYGVVRSAGDTSWYANRSFTFNKGTLRSVTLIARDLCGNIRTVGWVDNNRPSVAASVTIANQVCSGFRATVTGQANLTNPQYCLYNSTNTLVGCNTTGVFDITGYGAYCIRVQDVCYDTTIQRCFTVNQPVPAVAASVTITNLACSTFTASITGQANLTNPQYCLFDENNVQLACNSTGVFNNVAYGNYCIRITDGCTGTVINRCFTRLRPVPVVGTVGISNNVCSTFTATVNGQGNLNNPQYCLYDANNVLVVCNSTGVFTGLPYGNYCVDITNNSLCYDTVIRRCFTVGRPVPSVATNVSYTSQTCTSFTASITGQQNLNNPQYCLYNSSNTLVGCNTTGQFTNLAYGSYCIRVANSSACYDTTIQRCFTVNRPVPAVGASVQVSAKACSTFTATVTGQTNLTNPQYCLFDNNNVQVACNTTGVFTNVAYGNYCIRIVNTCYDTTIVRCFSSAPTPMALNVTAAASCTIGTTDFNASWAATSGPYNVQVYNPGGIQVRNLNNASNTISITGLPGLPVGLRYKVILTDQCGNKDSVMVTPNASWLNKSVNANSKCPSGQWQNGSGDLSVFCQYSNGTVTPKIIRKGALTVNITHNFNSGSNYTFSNMEPSDYIIEYTLQGCSGKVYDTFHLAAYTYPSLGQSAVYQCNNNSFGVNSIVNSGLAPFSYEIMGSQPSFPSIVSAQQVSPLFNINNGNSYSLVRLRVIDACGNATINDASILPLANTLVTASSNCFYNNIVLNVDTVANATYTWYRKTSPTDSVLIGNSQSYNIPYLMPNDTGLYVCKVSVNGGCLSRLSSFNVDGLCGGFALAENNFGFGARLVNEQTQVEWTTGQDFEAESFVVERSTDGRIFKTLGSVKAVKSVNGKSRYLFTDQSPEFGRNHYRIRINKAGANSGYSKIVVIDRSAMQGITVKPNPVRENFQVQFSAVPAGTYRLELVSASGALVHAESVTISAGQSKMFQRPAAARAGNYFLVVKDQQSGTKQVIKLLFQ